MAPGQGTRSDRAGGAGVGGEGPTRWEEVRGPGGKLPPPSTQESRAPCRVHPDFLFSFILRSATSRKFKILNII